MNEDVDWWKSFHVIEMADLFLQRSTDEELRETVAFLSEQLELTRGKRVYDQCCGVGTLSLELAKANINAVGADLCEVYIQRAKQDAESQNASCEFVCDDAFSFVPTLPCDATFNWYSSFGYASSDQRNESMLQRAFESLKPGGMFAMDVPNFPSLIRNFQFHLVRHGQSNGRDVTCLRESKIDWETGQLKQTWKWFSDNSAVVTRNSELRLYWPHQIQEMLWRVGFRQIRMLGDIDERSLDFDSPRLILIARRPA